jgi:hypothetical protein
MNGTNMLTSTKLAKLNINSDLKVQTNITLISPIGPQNLHSDQCKK